MLSLEWETRSSVRKSNQIRVRQWYALVRVILDYAIVNEILDYSRLPRLIQDYNSTSRGEGGGGII